MTDCLPAHLITAAMRLVGAVHEEGLPEVNDAMTGVDLRGLCIVLAAMVPDDKSPSELLEWNDGPRRSHQRKPAVAEGQLRLVTA